ncbi:SDR family oxidoreductase [Aurantimonas sp. MSK8Z-1]|uniref:SDR family NAD(P)-dependent oxidoreductase n=1 Tax=Mangrovibrevibacter kandeliae TaxID=2968473 RepID=UPI002118C7A4|nr:SDR family NAD(P)-dependent oxidoreductase [Aurantimonas sp. MSK8Z-1]MCW4115886.1 SDR family oxidoreductase [Aurantimonas sp. MSK8Z-1]
MEFQDKIVVVTGGAGVFGRWIAAHFAREGARLVLSDRRADELQRVVAELALAPDTTLCHATELTETSSILELAAAVKARWGAPDVVVNNAGLYPKFSLLDMDVADWDRIFAVNLRAPFLVSREMAKLMIAAGKPGSIVNISSGASRQMRNGSVPYCTSKTALERLSKGLALELAAHRIRVNVVEPGFAPGSEVSTLSDDYVERMTKRIPLGRTSGPQDAPGAIAYLCSDKASFITGAVLSVDGGNSIGTFETGELGNTPGTA